MTSRDLTSGDQRGSRGQAVRGLRDLRPISCSMAWRKKSARVSLGSSSGSMRALVPTGNRAGHVSNSFFGRAMCFQRYLLLTGVA